MKKAIGVLFFAVVGFSVHAEIIASPSSLNFFNQKVGTIGMSQSVMVINEGPGTVQLTLNNSCSFDFQVENMCDGQLMQGMSCEVEVTFDPQQAGTQNCSLELIDFTGGGTAYVSVSGDAVN